MTEDRASYETGDTTPTDNKMMASFRIDRELWAKFTKLAKSERLTATDVLTEYIQRCTENDKSEYAVNTCTDNVSTDTDNTHLINNAVMTAISTLSLPSKDDVSTMISTELESLKAEIEQLKKLDAIG